MQYAYVYYFLAPILYVGIGGLCHKKFNCYDVMLTDRGRGVLETNIILTLSVALGVWMPPLTLKTKWYHSCGCCDDSQSYEQQKKQVSDKYFLKKTLNQNHCNRKNQCSKCSEKTISQHYYKYFMDKHTMINMIHNLLHGFLLLFCTLSISTLQTFQ